MIKEKYKEFCEDIKNTTRKDIKNLFIVLVLCFMVGVYMFFSGASNICEKLDGVLVPENYNPDKFSITLFNFKCIAPPKLSDPLNSKVALVELISTPDNNSYVWGLN